MICITMLYFKAILQSIISTIVFVCVRANNQSELLYRSQTTLQHIQMLLAIILGYYSGGSSELTDHYSFVIHPSDHPSLLPCGQIATK
jgi:hypothetical protein